MNKRTNKRMAALLGAAALASTAFGASTPASATPPPYGHITLSVYAGEGTGGPLINQVELWCNSNGGSHPDPDAACAAVDKADGDFELLEGEPGPCTAEWMPVTAVADGYWHGGVTDIAFERSYGNRCALHRGTTPVFDF
ncbi:SSI family serine proteinase inhibitor [Yinghuangia sp. YIM S09857]|uniref:SSI family serine proteinase inhibitor n=1 Tax=Yinghuangia sp. YIM S09857 TaxID=3436929 RepID=UPI003F52C63D